MSSSILIVGLGNPGKEYINTRHNLGFRVVYELAQELGVDLKEHSCKAKWGRKDLEGKDIVFALPQTFVNVSGESVRQLMECFDLTVDDLFVVHDDLELPVGMLRVKKGGGSAGHNGLRSIIENIRDENFKRVRIGIGRPPGKEDPASFVLSAFNEKEEEQIELAVIEAKDMIAGFMHSIANSNSGNA